MAYLAGSATSISDFMSLLSTFMINQGWSLWDDLGADDKVFRSGRVFLRATGNGDNVDIRCYRRWDELTHQGHGPARGGFSAADAGFEFWLWTDGLALVAAACVGGDAYSGSYAGALKPIHDQTTRTLVTARTAGDDVVLSLDGNTAWSVDDKVMVLGKEAASHVTVKDAGEDTILVDLPHDHDVGDLVGIDPQPVGVSEFGVIAVTNFYMVNGLTEHPGDPGHPYTYHRPFEALDALCAPDDRSQNLFCSEVGVRLDKDVRGILRGVFLTPPTGVQARDTTSVDGVDHIALPVTDTNRLVLISTQITSFLAATTADATALFLGTPVTQGQMAANAADAVALVQGSPVATGALAATTEDATAEFLYDAIEGTMSGVTDDATATVFASMVRDATLAATTEDASAYVVGELGDILRLEDGGALTTESGLALEIEA